MTTFTTIMSHMGDRPDHQIAAVLAVVVVVYMLALLVVAARKEN